jgi:hypothetical protein
MSFSSRISALANAVSARCILHLVVVAAPEGTKIRGP